MSHCLCFRWVCDRSFSLPLSRPTGGLNILIFSPFFTSVQRSSPTAFPHSAVVARVTNNGPHPLFIQTIDRRQDMWLEYLETAMYYHKNSVEPPAVIVLF